MNSSLGITRPCSREFSSPLVGDPARSFAPVMQVTRGYYLLSFPLLTLSTRVACQTTKRRIRSLHTTAPTHLRFARGSWSSLEIPYLRMMSLAASSLVRPSLLDPPVVPAKTSRSRIKDPGRTSNVNFEGSNVSCDSTLGLYSSSNYPSGRWWARFQVGPYCSLNSGSLR